jgi:DNA polymerase III alpha subunit
VTWDEIKKIAVVAYKSRNLSEEYFERLKFEIAEIEKQGFERHWEEKVASNETVENKNNLVLTWLLGKTDRDPIAEGRDHIIPYSPEFPDIDIDFVPEFRESIKEYASDKYGRDFVCGVGSWTTFKPKSAIQDAARALGVGITEAKELTKNLPEEFDEMEKKAALEEFESFKEYYKDYKDVVDLAYRMRDRIKTQGKHAGGIIISSVPVAMHIPLTMSSKADRELGRWSSAWTEGRSLQLSKFGFIKFDLLGLRTLSWLWNCRNRIKKNHGIEIDWSDMSPESERAGWIINPDGSKEEIKFTDEKALAIADACKMETIFQFETDLATSIVAKGGVKSFNDLLMYTSLGRPGPLPMIDVYIKRRDGEEEWEAAENPKITDMLRDTYGIIVFQEDLAKMWTVFAGFTKPESEKARKAVAKKWVEQLVPIEEKWMSGASKTIGYNNARIWWERMVTFGRYAFNKSHAAAYTVMSYRCLWFKAHYLTEWWASVLSDPPHRDKLVRWMGIARLEGVEFGPINVNHLTMDFTTKDDKILPGLSMIKGIGASIANSIGLGDYEYTSIEQFIEKNGSLKILLERLIKLGGFDHIHKNRKALWYWWLYQYGSDKAARELKRHIKFSLAWDKSDIEAERKRQESEYFNMYPNRKKVPSKIANWVPTTANPNANCITDSFPEDKKDPEYKLCAKIEATRDDIKRIVGNDYDLREILKFEKEYLGFWWHSPMDMFETKGFTIEVAKERGVVEAVIQDMEMRDGARSDFMVMTITDGMEIARVMIWGDELAIQPEHIFKKNIGVKMKVIWNDKYRSFNLARGTRIGALKAKNAT